MNKTVKKQEGFTIIEVVLVLAIAALIMLMVFIALPALQRSQRDQQMEQDMSRLSSAITQHKSRNNGNLPATNGTGWNNFFGSHMRRGDDTFAAPNGGNYVAHYESATPGTMPQLPSNPSDEQRDAIYLYRGAHCEGEKAVGYSASSRRIAIVKPLEAGGTVCQEA